MGGRRAGGTGMNRPLVTVAFYVRNQAPFVEEALRSVLAQTYEPLQVVVSDDASDDGTYERMQAVLAGYQGPHTTVLNRNPRARGPGGQINRIMELAQGELVVQAHGDDVQMPQRVQRLWEEWEAGGRRAKLLYSAMTAIDAEGTVTGEVAYLPTASMRDVAGMLADLTGWRCLGCSAAFDRSVFDKFGRLVPEMMYEDRVLPVRARLLGEIKYVPEHLLKYRSHTGNISGIARVKSSRWGAYQRSQRAVQFTSQALKGHLHDLRVARRTGLISAAVHRELRAVAGRPVLALVLVPKLTSLPFSRRCIALRRAWRGRQDIGRFLNYPRGFQQIVLAAISPSLLKGIMGMLDRFSPKG